MSCARACVCAQRKCEFVSVRVSVSERICVSECVMCRMCCVCEESMHKRISACECMFEIILKTKEGAYHNYLVALRSQLLMCAIYCSLRLCLMSRIILHVIKLYCRTCFNKRQSCSIKPVFK